MTIQVEEEELFTTINAIRAILDELERRYLKPRISLSYVSKLKLFIEIFLAMSVTEVKEALFKEELLRTGKFSGEEIDMYIKKAKQNGQIFERKEGWLAKA